MPNSILWAVTVHCHNFLEELGALLCSFAKCHSGLDTAPVKLLCNLQEIIPWLVSFCIILLCISPRVFAVYFHDFSRLHKLFLDLLDPIPNVLDTPLLTERET